MRSYFILSCFCRNFKNLESFHKKISPRTIAVLGLQMVETTGLEPVTSCVWRYVGTSKPCYWVLSGTFGPGFCGYKSLSCPLCPPADFLILVSVLVKAPAPPNQAEPGLFLESKPCFRDSSLKQNDCQETLSDSGNLPCTTPAPSDGGEVN